MYRLPCNSSSPFNAPESDQVADIVLQKHSAWLSVPPVRLRTLTTMRTGDVVDVVPNVLRHLNENLLQMKRLKRW